MIQKNKPRKSSTDTLVSAMRILSRDIQSADGIANSAISEAADRIEDLDKVFQKVVTVLKLYNQNGIIESGCEQMLELQQVVDGV